MNYLYLFVYILSLLPADLKNTPYLMFSAEPTPQFGCKISAIFLIAQHFALFLTKYMIFDLFIHQIG